MRADRDEPSPIVRFSITSSLGLVADLLALVQAALRSNTVGDRDRERAQKDHASTSRPRGARPARYQVHREVALLLRRERGAEHRDRERAAADDVEPPAAERVVEHLVEHAGGRGRSTTAASSANSTPCSTLPRISSTLRTVRETEPSSATSENGCSTRRGSPSASSRARRGRARSADPAPAENAAASCECRSPAREPAPCRRSSASATGGAAAAEAARAARAPASRLRTCRYRYDLFLVVASRLVAVFTHRAMVVGACGPFNRSAPKTTATCASRGTRRDT